MAHALFHDSDHQSVSATHLCYHATSHENLLLVVTLSALCSARCCRALLARAPEHRVSSSSSWSSRSTAETSVVPLRIRWWFDIEFYSQQSHSRSAKLVKFKRSSTCSCGPAHTAPLQFVPVFLVSPQSCLCCVCFFGRRLAVGLRIPQDLSSCFCF